MQVICLEDEAFNALVNTLIKRVEKRYAVKEDRWISGEEAMAKLRIKAKSTLQKLRDEGQIRFSQPEKKIILYDLHSIYAYLDKHAHDTF